MKEVGEKKLQRFSSWAPAENPVAIVVCQAVSGSARQPTSVARKKKGARTERENVNTQEQLGLA